MRTLALVAALFAAALMMPSKGEAAAGNAVAAPVAAAGVQAGLTASGLANARSGLPAARSGLPGYKEAAHRRRRWRRSRRWHRRRWRRHHDDIGDAIAAGILGAITLGIIAESTRVSRDRYDWERCDREYRSFRWSDGTFQPYGGGPRRLCPYLR